MRGDCIACDALFSVKFVLMVSVVVLVSSNFLCKARDKKRSITVSVEQRSISPTKYT